MDAAVIGNITADVPMSIKPSKLKLKRSTKSAAVQIKIPCHAPVRHVYQVGGETLSTTTAHTIMSNAPTIMAFLISDNFQSKNDL